MRSSRSGRPTGPPTPGSSSVTTPWGLAPEGAAVVTRGSARVQRLLYGAVGVGAVAFGLLSLDLIIKQFGELVPWFAWATVIVAVGLPILIAVCAIAVPLPALRVMAVSTVLAFVALFVAWPFFMLGDTLSGGSPAWISQVAAVHGTLAAITCAPVLAWAYVGSLAVVVAVVRYVAFGGQPFLLALLDGLNALLIMVILGGVAMALRAASRAQDAAMLQAHAEAVRASRLQGRARESARIDGIVHDDIISALLTAGRDVTGEIVQHQAQRALGRIDVLDADPEASPARTPQELAHELSLVIGEHDPDVVLVRDFRVDTPIPGDVATALIDALRESVRNCVRHAGGVDEVRVVIAEGELGIRIVDGGPGFVPGPALARGGGLRVSVVERMAGVPGGSATIESWPGGGTVVSLRWEPQ